MSEHLGPVQRAVRAALAEAGDPSRVVVALSGGADSIALLAATVAEASRTDLVVHAVTIDHGLQTDSAQVAATARDLAGDLGADSASVERVEVTGAGGPEAAARRARYAALRTAALRRGAGAVLVGHTRDDQAETVLLGLARGSGARSLAGMRPVSELSEETSHRWRASPDTSGESGDGERVLLLRPLLGIDRATTEAVCAELGLVPWQDPHNADPAYARVRVRRELLPEVERVLGAGSVEALARTADLLRDDADALDAWAARVRVEVGPGDGAVGVDAEALAEQPAAVRRRVLRAEALAAGVPAGSLTASHLHALDSLVARWTGQGELALPGPVAAERSCGRVTFRER